MEQLIVLLIGTFDTKAEELLFLREQILAHGLCGVRLLDVGKILQTAASLNVPDDEFVPRLLRIAQPDASLPRGEYVKQMIAQCKPIINHLILNNEIHGVVSAAGSTGTSLACDLMRNGFPVGFPKLMVSTMASGDIKPFIEESDISMMYSVVDIAGINSVLETVLTNAAGAIVGMTTAHANHLEIKRATEGQRKKRIAITMFGVTTPCVDKIRGLLKEAPYNDPGFEVFVFHATGAGGTAMERLITEGHFDAVIDLTTTEICDLLFDGVLACRPDRLEAAAKAGVPTVLSVGACDMINFGARDTLPSKHEGRNIYEHNPAVTLLRTNKEECSSIGAHIADKLKANAKHPAMINIILPTAGVSMIDKEGGPFHDADADEALFNAIEAGLKETSISVERLSHNINDDEFAQAAVQRLLHLLEGAGEEDDGYGDEEDEGAAQISVVHVD